MMPCHVDRKDISNGKIEPVISLAWSLLFYCFLGTEVVYCCCSYDWVFKLCEWAHIIDWRERLAMQHLKSLFSKEVIETIAANTEDLWHSDLATQVKNLSNTLSFHLHEGPQL